MVLCVLTAALSASMAQAEGLAEMDKDLLYRVSLGRAEEVDSLLRKGANANAQNEEFFPALAVATLRTDKEALPIAKLLVEAGAQLEQRDPNGNTPLMNAITTNNPLLVNYLLERDADFYAADKQGRGVLQLAQWYGNPDVIRLVNDAMDKYEAQNRSSRSVEHRNRRLSEYIYYNCALQYLSFYRDSKQDRLDEAEFNGRLEKANSMIAEAYGELIQNLNIDARYLDNVAESSRMQIFNELEGMISNRNRRKHGVGSKEDLDKRCKAVLKPYEDAMHGTIAPTTTHDPLATAREHP